MDAHVVGARVVIVSGTYEPVLRLFAERVGAEAVGTPLEFSGDVFTGRLAGPVNTGARKIERLARLIGTASFSSRGPTATRSPTNCSSARRARRWP